jgi:hypothetical protein
MARIRMVSLLFSKHGLIQSTVCLKVLFGEFQAFG